MQCTAQYMHRGTYISDHNTSTYKEKTDHTLHVTFILYSNNNIHDFGCRDW